MLNPPAAASAANATNKKTVIRFMLGNFTFFTECRVCRSRGPPVWCMTAERRGQQPAILDSLAAAYAEVGRFTDAVDVP